MAKDGIEAALMAFGGGVAKAMTADAVWEALQSLAQTLAGHRLFTVMTVDLAAGLARRAYSSNPVAYPSSGTKPIQHDAWFDIVHGQHRSFVANSITDIAKVFPDHALIQSLGCGSVVNLPVVLAGELIATINLLDAEGHYTPARVAVIETHLAIPAKLTCLAAQRLT